MKSSLAVAVHHDIRWLDTRRHDTKNRIDADLHARSFAWPWQRTARTALLLSLITTDFQAHADEGTLGATLQGATLQGATLQGATLQGSALRAAGMQGSRFVGSLQNTDGSPVSIEILGFRGDRVLVRMQGAQDVQEFEPTELRDMTWTAEACDSASTCETFTYRIASVDQDRSTNTMVAHANNSDVWLYAIDYRVPSEPGLDTWMPLCTGESPAGLFVDGLWHEDGSHDATGYTFSCLDGVIAKCVRGWGYKPWKTLWSEAHGNVSLAPLHQTCTRAARADYCGDGISHTQNGTLIDIFDGFGFNVRDESQPFSQESGFGANGARWVARPRWPTGVPIDGGWRFPTCERPSSDPTFQDEPAWLEVWSNHSP